MISDIQDWLGFISYYLPPFSRYFGGLTVNFFNIFTEKFDSPYTVIEGADDIQAAINAYKNHIMDLALKVWVSEWYIKKWE